ncbi:MAG: endo-1,4-beta-xylanase [Fidelibacterota bacterium]|nr:MAG: endo-1,4-beta-xylanase [Candidatus Neomarinimicrobiota bacterium]
MLTKRVVFVAICLLGFLPAVSSAQPLAEGKDKFLGNAIGNVIWPHFDNYWNQVTPGNAGKWGSVEYVQDSYNWTKLDEIYNYAISNGFVYKHHTLIWGNQQPGWIAGLDSASQRAEIEEWIQLVGERYPLMDFVDVVNEPLHDPPDDPEDGNYISALGGTGATGWDWVITSFELARQYCDTTVKLVLNEYNVLHSSSTTDQYLALIDTLNVRGLIDAIGIQGHSFELRSDRISTMESNLDRLAATGLPVYITEFDINEADDDVQLEKYQTWFPLFWEHPAVKGLTLWGYLLGDIWQTNAWLVDEGGNERPALQWLRYYLISPLPPVLISPVAVVDQPRDPVLIWHTSESALTYNVQLSTSSVFTEFTVILDTTVVDTSLQVGVLNTSSRYWWRVNATNESGTSLWAAITYFITGDQIVSTEDGRGLLAEYRLLQNYPNPFNPATTIRYSLATGNHVRLQIYDLAGREIRTLINTWMPAGRHSVTLRADELSSGIYLYRITTPGFKYSRRMIIMK